MILGCLIWISLCIIANLGIIWVVNKSDENC